VVDTSGSFIVSAWVKPDDLAATCTVLSRDGVHASAFLLWYAKDVNRWAFGIFSADDAAGPVEWAVGATAPEATTWTMVTAVFDAEAMQARLYLDGKP
jgi:glycerophosphoryl diester phosphodiesterase